MRWCMLNMLYVQRIILYNTKRLADVFHSGHHSWTCLQEDIVGVATTRLLTNSRLAAADTDHLKMLQWCLNTCCCC